MNEFIAYAKGLIAQAEDGQTVEITMASPTTGVLYGLVFTVGRGEPAAISASVPNPDPNELAFVAGVVRQILGGPVSMATAAERMRAMGGGRG